MIKEIVPSDHEGYMRRKARFLFSILVTASLLLSFITPDQSGPSFPVFAFLILGGFLQGMASALIVCLLTTRTIPWKFILAMGAVLAPANILTSAAAWQYAGFLALCYAFAFFFVKSISPFLKSLWIKIVQELKHPLWRDF